MRIIKTIQGVKIELEIEKIKDYPRYGLYQVYRPVNGKHIPLYKECYSNLQIREILEKGIIEEVLE